MLLFYWFCFFLIITPKIMVLVHDSYVCRVFWIIDAFISELLLSDIFAVPIIILSFQLGALSLVFLGGADVLQLLFLSESLYFSYFSFILHRPPPGFTGTVILVVIFLMHFEYLTLSFPEKSTAIQTPFHVHQLNFLTISDFPLDDWNFHFVS